jgi:hypothetical protein
MDSRAAWQMHGICHLDLLGSVRLGNAVAMSVKTHTRMQWTYVFCAVPQAYKITLKN